MALSTSVSVSKLRVPLPLEDPSCPITKSAGRDCPNELEQGLQILPNKCHWQAVIDHLHCE